MSYPFPPNIVPKSSPRSRPISRSPDRKPPPSSPLRHQHAWIPTKTKMDTGKKVLKPYEPPTDRRFISIGRSKLLENQIKVYGPSGFENRETQTYPEMRTTGAQTSDGIKKVSSEMQTEFMKMNNTSTETDEK